MIKYPVSIISLSLINYTECIQQLMGHSQAQGTSNIEPDFGHISYPKDQVHKLGGSRDIYIQKCVIFGSKIYKFFIGNVLLASDVVCIWLLIEQSQSVIVIVKGK